MTWFCHSCQFCLNNCFISSVQTYYNRKVCSVNEYGTWSWCDRLGVRQLSGTRAVSQFIRAVIRVLG